MNLVIAVINGDLALALTNNTLGLSNRRQWRLVLCPGYTPNNDQDGSRKTNGLPQSSQVLPARHQLGSRMANEIVRLRGTGLERIIRIEFIQAVLLGFIGEGSHASCLAPSIRAGHQPRSD